MDLVLDALRTNNANFFQVVCDKHDYVEVIQTYTSGDKIETTFFYQCRFCGKMISEQKDAVCDATEDDSSTVRPEN